MTLLAASARRRNVPPSGPPYAIPTSAPFNVPQPIVTPTYEGSGQAVHLDVIDFNMEPTVQGTWHGWRFWMVNTPYPNSRDNWENPSILVSQDGWQWQVPPGLTNPLYIPPSGYNSDPDIAYDPASDELVLVYRDHNFELVSARSSDGITWPASTTPVTWTPTGGSWYSPSILRTPDGTWHLWVDQNSNSVLHWTGAAPEGPFGSSIGWVSISGGWHSNVAFAGGTFYLLTHSIANGRMTAGTSNDGSSFTQSPVIPLTNQSGEWDASLYRPAMTLHENGTHMRVWYSGQSSAGVWRVGYTLVPLSVWSAT